MSNDSPSPTSRQMTPLEAIGGEAIARRIITRFYDHMDDKEPALARLHDVDEHGHVTPAMRERLAVFLIEWLGGPTTYSEQYGHPRLRWRHARVPVNVEMRDAWMRCMERALDDVGISGDVRAFLDARFGETAEMLRNRPG
jgi:hemoglobin